jgi:hypothetical protein
VRGSGRHRLTFAAILVGTACASWSRGVGAQTAEEVAYAEKLFAEGSALVKSGRYDEGCPRLQQAQKLVRGIGVTLYVGACYEQRGELLRAWEEFKAAEETAAARGDGRAGVARDRREKVWPRLARLEIVVPAASDAADLVVTDDDVAVPRDAWSSERPVEPRAHRIRASARGREPWELSVEARAGSVVAVEVPPLKPVAVAPAPSSSPATAASVLAPAVAVAPSPPPRRDSRPAPLAPLPAVAVAAWGVSAIGFGLGIGFGLDAKSKMDASNAGGHCQPNDRCDATGLSLRSNAMTSAAYSTADFVVGAACLAGGLVLYLTTPRRETVVAVSPGAEEGGVSLAIRRPW